MSKREEFRTRLNTIKTTLQTITAEQRKEILRLGVQQHGLTPNEAADIFNASGIIVGGHVNYFEVLELSISDVQNLNDTIIVSRVKAAHKKLYNASLIAGGRPRADGKTEEQWRTVLNQARDTLKDPQKRLEHIAILQTDIGTTSGTGSGSNYPPEWKLLSFQCREEAGWKCEECSIDLGLSHNRKFLHAHHVEGLEHNQPEDLKALCVGCHAEQPNHAQLLKKLPVYLEFMDKYGDIWRQLTGR